MQFVIHKYLAVDVFSSSVLEGYVRVFWHGLLKQDNCQICLNSVSLGYSKSSHAVDFCYIFP